MELKNFCSVCDGFEALCRLLPFASVGFNVIIAVRAGSAGLSTPDTGSRALLGQPGLWMGGHLEVPGHRVVAKNTANGRPQKPCELKGFGPSISDGQEQEKSSENTVFAPGCRTGRRTRAAACIFGALTQGIF